MCDNIKSLANKIHQYLIYQMISKSEFLQQIQKDNPGFGLEKIAEAYDFCCEAHKEQKRKSGEPYAVHPISVALEVSKINIDENSVIAALLHDVVEDTKYTAKDIETRFSKDVRNIVEGVTKFEKIQFQEKQARQVENFRKLFLAMSKDIRVLIVKLCDRVHNMRTLEFQKPEKQKTIALETLEIYAPLAERIGLQRIKNELQDLSFRILKPDEYAEIVQKIGKLKMDFDSSHAIEDIIKELQDSMQRHNVVAQVFGREKTPYSVWRKMHKNDIAFEEVSDIIAFRVIVDTKEDCYRALGAIHTDYNAIPGKFKDYISIPKSNGYSSLHTKIMGPRGRIVDIQIRTKAMHDEDEFGLASHWKYKQGITTDNKLKYLRASWINRVLNILQESNQNNVLSDAKTEISENHIIVFTHDGYVVELPGRATVLDFAFAIDTDSGIYFDYAVVNGQHVGIDHILRNGDKVTICKSEKPQVNRVWLNYTITGKARNEIISRLS